MLITMFLIIELSTITVVRNYIILSYQKVAILVIMATWLIRPKILSLKSLYVYNEIIFNLTIWSLKRVLRCLWLPEKHRFLDSIISDQHCRMRIMLYLPPCIIFPDILDALQVHMLMLITLCWWFRNLLLQRQDKMQKFHLL